MSKIEKIVGTWAPLIGGEFRKPYMKELHTKIEAKKKNKVLEGFQPEGDLFEVFKRTPLNKLKVIYVVDTPEFNPIHLRDIEVELFDGFNVDLTGHPDYWWLHEQGIMFLPRHLSWGNQGPHKEWKQFIDEVILAAAGMNDRILIVTNQSAIQKMLFAMHYPNNFVSKLRPWRYVDKYIENNFGEQINWSPPQ